MVFMDPWNIGFGGGGGKPAVFGSHVLQELAHTASPLWFMSRQVSLADMHGRPRHVVPCGFIETVGMEMLPEHGLGEDQVLG